MNEKYCGQSMKSMSIEEMQSIYGANSIEVEPQSLSLLSVASLSFVGSYLASAAFKCGKDNK